MPCWKGPGDYMSDFIKNYLAKGWIVECVDDSQSGWLILSCKPEEHDFWIADPPILKKGNLYRVEKADEGYFVKLKGVPGRWRTSRFKVFTSKLEDLKHEVPVKIELPRD